jgi:hypothetical protein
LVAAYQHAVREGVLFVDPSHNHNAQVMPRVFLADFLPPNRQNLTGNFGVAEYWCKLRGLLNNVVIKKHRRTPAGSLPQQFPND